MTRDITSSSGPIPSSSDAPPGEPRTAAVVVTFNRKALLRQCLAALQAQTHPLTAIYVVDNASSDGTAAMVRAEFPGVTLIRLDENRGGAGGFSAGMKAALQASPEVPDVEWVWIMDDDAEPAADALDALFAPGVHAEPDTTALSSLPVGANGQPQDNHAGWYDPVRMRYRFSRPDGPSVHRINYASFVGLLVRADAARRVGLPDPGFFLRGDDNEYSLRLAQAGPLYLVRSSRIVHHDAFSTQEKRVTGIARVWRERPIDDYWVQYYVLRNHLLMARAYASSPLQQAVGVARGLAIGLRKLAIALASGDRTRVRLRLIVKALRDGLCGVTGKRVDPATFPDGFERNRAE